MGVRGWSSWATEHCGWNLRLCLPSWGPWGHCTVPGASPGTHSFLPWFVHSLPLPSHKHVPMARWCPHKLGSWGKPERNETVLALSNCSGGHTTPLMEHLPPWPQAPLLGCPLPWFFQVSAPAPLSWRPSQATSSHFLSPDPSFSFFVARTSSKSHRY